MTKNGINKGKRKEKLDEELTDEEVLKKLFPKEARKIIRPAEPRKTTPELHSWRSPKFVVEITGPDAGQVVSVVYAGQALTEVLPRSGLS